MDLAKLLTRIGISIVTTVVGWCLLIVASHVAMMSPTSPALAQFCLYYGLVYTLCFLAVCNFTAALLLHVQACRRYLSEKD